MAMTKRAKADAAIVPTDAMEAPEALAAVKKFKATKFDQSVEICMHLGVDVKHADQMVRGSVSLPNGIGKSKRVIAFCAPEHVKDALAAGAVEAGGDELVNKVKGGWFDFDVAIASPEMMRVMSVLGKVLGPKGLMPSPKNGTVTPKVAEAVKDFSAGKLEYRADKGGNVHAILGKMSFSEADLLENYNHFVTTIEKARPSTVKGQYVKKITLSGTMTPGVRVAIVSDEE
jgi:large subunit ribosomal protein L1